MRIIHCSCKPAFFLLTFIALLAVRPARSEQPEDPAETAKRKACEELEPLRDLGQKQLTEEQLVRRAELWVLCENNYAKALEDAETVLRGTDSKLQELSRQSHQLRQKALYSSAYAARNTGETNTAALRFTELISCDSQNYVLMWETITILLAAEALAFDEYDPENPSPPAPNGIPDILDYANILMGVTSDYECRLARARFYRHSPEYKNNSQARLDYDSARADTRAPLVVFVEEAEFIVEDWNQSPQKYADAANIYAAAIERFQSVRCAPTPTNAPTPTPGPSPTPCSVDNSFPPEWRIRMAQIMKAMEPDCNPLTEDCEFKAECKKAIETIDKLQAQTLPSAALYALRASALREMGHALRSRSDAIRAWKLYQKQTAGSEPTPPWPDTCGILHSVLGHHLLFGANHLNVAAHDETTTFCSEEGIQDKEWLNYLNDGLAPEGTEWNSNQYAIEFDYNSTDTVHYLGLDFHGHCEIDHISAQADNNDVYQVQYSDEDAASHTAVTQWHNLYTVPDVSAPGVYAPGLRTRESGSLGPIRLRWLRIYPVSGDGWYSVSELRAFSWQESQECE